MFQESYPQTTFSFSLPVGLIDNFGRSHQEGVMRLATGKDEFYQQDPRSLENPTYGILILLSRVIVRLGDFSPLVTEDLEGLFLKDWQYLQEVYNAINPPEAAISVEGEF
jgi:hypothetical protein